MRALCTCTAGRGFIRCRNRAAGMITLMCVHEHQHLCTLCPGCLAEVRKLGPVKCHHCDASARPHVCGMAEVKWEPLDE